MTVITKLSPAGVADLGAHEGFVSRTYRCPAGVLTIGFGFTMGSMVFADYWRTKYGRGLKPGDTITREEAEKLLIELVNHEYGVTVADKIKPQKQCEFDGASSVLYNCGKGAANWRWAKALAAGDVKSAAALLRTTAVTANGKRLPGLVKRRAAEALMIERGVYSSRKAIRIEPATDIAPAATADDELAHYQGILARLGHYKGQLDGLAGPKTTAAVRAFQETQPNLNVDGILGTGTAAALDRADAAGDRAKDVGAAAFVSIGSAAAAAGGAPVWVYWVAGAATAFALLAAGVYAWRYRDEIRAAIKRRATA